MFSSVVLKTTAQTALNFVLALSGRLLKQQKADSLVSFTKATRVEPIALVDQRLTHLPYMNDVMQSVSSIFIGYYLQAVSLAVNVGKINVIKLLDALNPSRDVADSAATRISATLSGKPGLLSMESYQYSLPTPDQPIGLEAFGDDALKLAMKNPDAMKGMQQVAADVKKSDLSNGAVKSNVKFDSDISKFVTEAVNLSVGKLISVEIEDDGKRASFQIMVRVISHIASPASLVHILADGSRWLSTAKERYHAWRANQLEFIRDIVLCQDLIDEHKKALLNDKSGVYKEILDRRTKNAAAGFFGGGPSIATASNILVLSSQTVKEIEQEIGGRFSDAHTRDRVFKNSYVMLMVEIDTFSEQVTFYHRGISLATEMSIKELKSASKGTGPDVAEILKAYQLGYNPNF